MTAINRITRDDVETFKLVPAFNIYQRIATQSAIYPGQGTTLGLIYTALKMNGEAGEFAEHVGKAMRDDDLLEIRNGDDGRRGDEPCVCLDDGELTADRHTLLVKEIGDVLWYLSAACNELGITLAEAAATNLEKLCDRGERNQLQGSGDTR